MNMMPPPNIGDSSENKRLIFYDYNGQPILSVISSSEYVIHHPNGQEEEFKDFSFISLSDGTLIYPSCLFSPDAKIRVGACRLCRRPSWSLFGREEPTHGLVLIGQKGGARNCRYCGATICRTHQCWVGGRPYCSSPCARRAKFKRLLRKLFFSIVEE